MPQFKNVTILRRGNILPKFEISMKEPYGDYSNDQRQLSSSYLSILADMDKSQILTSEPESDATDSTPHRPRKRQRLDHLSQEEKVLRRKLKNRVAAQTARDRKKARMVELEEQVAELEEEKRILLLHNLQLRNTNSALEKENEELKVRLGTESCTLKVDKVKIEEAEKVAESKELGENRSLEHASFIYVPLLKEQDLKFLTLWMMQFVYLPAIARLMTFLIYCSSVVKILCSVTSVAPFHKVEKLESTTHQALKWWGPHQKAWNPTKN